MEEFLPRTEPVASVVGVTDRGFAGAQDIPVANRGKAATEANAQQDPQLTERSAAAANYAKIQADIANVVAQLEPPPARGADAAAAAADQALVALMPAPVVMLPMPPTDQHMIEFVAQVAQSVASQAAMARAAQARVSPAVVDQVIH